MIKVTPLVDDFARYLVRLKNKAKEKYKEYKQDEFIKVNK